MDGILGGQGETSLAYILTGDFNVHVESGKRKNVASNFSYNHLQEILGETSLLERQNFRRTFPCPADARWDRIPSIFSNTEQCFDHVFTNVSDKVNIDVLELPFGVSDHAGIHVALHQ